jgi:hypothetical protein
MRLIILVIILSIFGCSKEFCGKLHRANIQIAQQMNSLMDCNPALVVKKLDKMTDATLGRSNPSHRGAAGMAANLACQVAMGAFANYLAKDWEREFECNPEKVAKLIGTGKPICGLFNLLPY